MTFIPTLSDLSLERRIARLQQKDEACLLKLTELVAMRRPEYCAHMEAERLKRVRGES